MKRERSIPRKSPRRDNPMRDAHKPFFWSEPPLLRGERAADFQILLDGFSRDIRPRGLIDEIYLVDIVWLTWEIIRLRRCRTPIIKANYFGALQSLLAELIQKPGEFVESAHKRAKELALKWFTTEQGKEEVRKILSRFDLDESVIEAGAIRRSSRDLEGIDKLLVALEARRNKAFACIADYRLSSAIAPEFRPTDRGRSAPGRCVYKDVTGVTHGHRTSDRRQPT